METIIVDGGSEKHNIDYVNEIISHSSLNIKYIKGERLNISQGLNNAIKHASSEFVMVMAVGNKYKDNCTEVLARTIVREKLDYAYCPFL